MSNLIDSTSKLLLKIQEAKDAEDLVKKLEDKVRNIKKKVWEIIESKYDILLDSSTKENYAWRPGTFGEDLQLILRSVLRRDEVVHIPSGEDREVFNLTSKHGLKYPRTWSAHSFLPYSNREKTAFLKNEKYYDGYLEIDFSVLRNSKYVDSKRLNKFFYYLRKSLGIYRLRRNIEREWESHFHKKEGSEWIKNLREYSNLDEYVSFLKVESTLKEHYETYMKSLEDYKVKETKLLAELKEFTKPFRLFLTLKDGSDNS